MTGFRPREAVAVLLLLSAAGAGAQAPVFRSETRLVVLHASVTNKRGELVTNLDERAFSVFENGKRQPIMLFRRDDIPVSIGLLIDNSGSMRSLRSRVEAAALAFARASNPEDEMFVLNFADKTRLDVPMTSDPRVLERGIARVDSIGGTAMRDALEAAESYLHDHAKQDRRVLLVITDGIDNASTATAGVIQRQAEQTETVIYAIGLFHDQDESRASTGRHELKDLTERTGGVAYFPQRRRADRVRRGRPRSPDPTPVHHRVCADEPGARWLLPRHPGDRQRSRPLHRQNQSGVSRGHWRAGDRTSLTVSPFP